MDSSRNSKNSSDLGSEGLEERASQIPGAQNGTILPSCADDLEAIRREHSNKQCDPVPPNDEDSGNRDMEDLLADLDPEALAGTETHEEVIAEMTVDDLDAPASRSPTPGPDAALKDVSASARDRAPNDPDSGMSFDSFQRLTTDEPDWFTRCISRGGPTSETLTEADVEPPAPTPTPATPPVWWIGPADDPDGIEWTLEAYERLCALADAKETTDLIAEVIEAEIAKIAAVEAAPAPPEPDPAPTPGPAPDVAPAIGLTSDQLEAVADRKPSDELSHEVTTSHPEREKIAAKARENVALLQNARAKKAAKAERAAAHREAADQHFTSAKDCHGMRSWEETKRLQDRDRKRRQREREAKAKLAPVEKTDVAELDAAPATRPMPRRVSRQYKLRLDALRKATAAPKARKSLEKLRDREEEIADFWVVLQVARKRFGERAFDAKVAQLHYDKSMNKRRAQNRREIIAELEQPGGPWHEFSLA